MIKEMGVRILWEGGPSIEPGMVVRRACLCFAIPGLRQVATRFPALSVDQFRVMSIVVHYGLGGGVHGVPCTFGAKFRKLRRNRVEFRSQVIPKIAVAEFERLDVVATGQFFHLPAKANHRTSETIAQFDSVHDKRRHQGDEDQQKQGVIAPNCC